MTGERGSGVGGADAGRGRFHPCDHDAVQRGAAAGATTRCGSTRTGSPAASSSSRSTACPRWRRRPRGDFHWLVYFDAGTPEPIRRRIEACREVFPFVPWFCRADQRRVLAGLARRGAAGADALAAHHPLRQRRRAGGRPRRPAAGGGGARGAAAGVAELPAGLRAGRGRQALRAHPPRQLVRELARALGRQGAHRDLDQPPEDDPGRAGPPARRRRRLAAGGARRQRLEQGARPPGGAGGGGRDASPPPRSPTCAAPRGSRSRSRTWCSPRSAAPATPRSR